MKKRILLKFFALGFLFLSFCFFQAHAEVVPSSPGPLSPFQPNQWNKSLDLIEAKLSQKNWTPQRIHTTLAVLTDLQKNARECIHSNQAELDRINLALAQPQPQGAAVNPNQPQAAPAVSLSGREIGLSNLRAECRLFLIRSEEVLSEVDKLNERVVATEVFSKGMTLVDNLRHLPQWSELFKAADTSLLLQKIGFPYFTKVTVGLLGFFLVAGFILGRCFSAYSANKLVQTKRLSLTYTVMASFARYSYWLSLSLSMSVFFILYSWPTFYTFLGQLSSYIFIYFFLLAWLQAIFHPPLGAKAMVSLPEPIPAKLDFRLVFLLTLVLLYYVCSAWVYGQNLPISLLELGMSLYLSLLSIAATSIILLTLRFPKLKKWNRYLHSPLNLAIIAILLTVLFSEWLGYHYFSIFLVKNIILTFLLVCLAFCLHFLIRQQIERLEQHPGFRYHLGVRMHRSIPELSFLKFVLWVVMWGALLGVLLNCWVLSAYYYTQLMHAIMDGFRIFGIYLVPSRILFAAVIFVVLMLGNRLVQVYISHHSPHYVEEGAQVVTASIVGYVGFAVFLVISLVIAGVNFTGLAIIAGALSVGIGFGLQHIVNNFISGLILLLDDNIRPGDRIQVGDIEGIVKRIRLRATHIYTPRHADIFIPNSELISKSVTNFVFHDKTWSIFCTVGVAYGSDVVKVKEILLKTAESHPEVIQETGKKPAVFLKKFEESQIVFELWCLISDINKKGGIESDLNIAIYEAFTKNQIAIPYPQQDVYIKNWPGR